MRRPMIFALAAALAAPSAAAAQPAPAAAAAQSTTSIAMDCGAAAGAAAGEAPSLHGNWDFLMDIGGEPSFGLMSIGYFGDSWGGSVTPARTAPVVLREIALAGSRIKMVVASPDGDILFDGTLSPRGDRMCGTVTYHGGRTFPMLAQKRPSTYRWQPRAERPR